MLDVTYIKRKYFPKEKWTINRLIQKLASIFFTAFNRNNTIAIRVFFWEDNSRRKILMLTSESLKMQRNINSHKISYDG